MNDDIDAVAAAQPGAVTRRAEVRDPGEGDVYVAATLSQVYRTDVADLWQAVTDPSRLARWFGEVTGDLALGGRFDLAGYTAGTILECEPPRRYRTTWEHDGSTSHVEVVVEREGDGARLTLTHSGENARDFYEQFGVSATGLGWDLGLFGLAASLTADWIKPDDEDPFFVSPLIRTLLTSAARDWAEASIATGVPEERARAQSERSARFFTEG
ncbi:SRPBCC family protein [Tsukamurella sp. 1534]|uniref:SRPBCC family protein n=1 Tax=Tsukamurella sp. 1534 TaxID=1151061 RepID=UPI0002EC1466|nr:SRPBCC family protein [Tsukamurella sp. 1534]